MQRSTKLNYADAAGLPASRRFGIYAVRALSGVGGVCITFQMAPSFVLVVVLHLVESVTVMLWKSASE